ncbi:hypothetical protein BT69DRAFT_996145 [Atractiella rhizophila]|nr:hypothetical protein BT69DRAFT_996145 [Atractiella rhizophila]
MSKPNRRKATITMAMPTPAIHLNPDMPMAGPSSMTVNVPLSVERGHASGPPYSIPSYQHQGRAHASERWAHQPVGSSLLPSGRNNPQSSWYPPPTSHHHFHQPSPYEQPQHSQYALRPEGPRVLSAPIPAREDYLREPFYPHRPELQHPASAPNHVTFNTMPFHTGRRHSSTSRNNEFSSPLRLPSIFSSGRSNLPVSSERDRREDTSANENAEDKSRRGRDTSGSGSGVADKATVPVGIDNIDQRRHSFSPTLRFGHLLHSVNEMPESPTFRSSSRPTTQPATSTLPGPISTSSASEASMIPTSTSTIGTGLNPSPFHHRLPPPAHLESTISQRHYRPQEDQAPLEWVKGLL